jgi:hypothetical protein
MLTNKASVSHIMIDKNYKNTNENTQKQNECNVLAQNSI